MKISFDNTENAFSYKSTKDLKESKFIFRTMAYQPLIDLGVRLTPLAIKLHLPIRRIVRRTIFKQFVGGETLEETSVKATMLTKYGVKVILDYGVEGKEGEASFEQATEHFIKTINYASTRPKFPFSSDHSFQMFTPLSLRYFILVSPFRNHSNS